MVCLSTTPLQHPVNQCTNLLIKKDMPLKVLDSITFYSDFSSIESIKHATKSAGSSNKVFNGLGPFHVITLRVKSF